MQSGGRVSHYGRHLHQVDLVTIYSLGASSVYLCDCQRGQPVSVKQAKLESVTYPHVG